MAIDAWYLQKSEQCALLEAKATDPHKRARYKEEGRLWRELADEFAKRDRSALASFDP